MNAQQRTRAVQRSVQTPVLEIAFEESGTATGFPVILLHGFPDDVRAWDDVAASLATRGYRIIVPYLRGYGPTRFRESGAPRMAEQAALAQDVIDLADALGVREFAVSGYDWGGRAAAIVAALHPERVRAAVLVAGYTIQNVFAAPQAMPPDRARAFWYQWYFNTEQGRAGLERNRHALCRLLWQTWSPTWHFTDATYDATAPSFENPDFVECVIHSYRHRLGNAPGEPRFIDVERRLARRPRIEVPAITLYGTDDALVPASANDAGDRVAFSALRARRLVRGGHFLPRENPEAVSAALTELL
jgi:pimeloyl-ACP methyl ester carboxylesterase